MDLIRFAQLIQQVLTWIQIWEIWRPSQHLKRVVVLLKSFLKHFALRQAASGNTVSMRRCAWSATRGGGTVGGMCQSNTWLDPEFPSKLPKSSALPKASHCFLAICLLMQTINKHASSLKFRVKGRTSPWFSSGWLTFSLEINFLLKSQRAFLTFPKLQIKRDLKKFWKVMKSAYGDDTVNDLLS